MNNFRDYLFGWEEIKEEDKNRLMEYLRLNYNSDWIKTADIKKSDDGQTIEISDENNSNKLFFRLNGKQKGNITINESRTDEFIVKKEKNKSNLYVNQNSGPGGSFVGRAGIVLIMAYLLFISLFILYSLGQFWSATQTTQAINTTFLNASSVESVNVAIFNNSFPISKEVHLLFLVGLAGSLGGIVHTLRSFYWYVGMRALVWSWIPMYVLLPFVGASLGLIFYLVIRGGFFSFQSDFNDISVFGFVALSVLVGLFSEQAALRLKEVAGTVFTEREQGTNHVEPQDDLIGGKE